MQRPPFWQRPHVEYYAMPPGVKVCNHSKIAILQQVALSTGTVSAIIVIEAWLLLRYVLSKSTAILVFVMRRQY